MDYENVGNNSGSMTAEIPELAELDIEFAGLAEEFGLGDAADHGALNELDAAVEGTELDAGQSESAGGLSILDIADGAGGFAESQPEFFGAVGNWIKKKAARLIRKLIALVRKYAKYKSCIPAVMKAVAAFKARKWGTALRAAYAAYRCIKSK